MPEMNRILVTGAAGRIGGAARAALGEGRSLVRLLDVLSCGDLRPHEEAVVADVADLGAVTNACEGIECLVHLAGIPTEAAWEDLLAPNVIGPYTAFEAARRAGVRRIVYASSNHAVGFHPIGTRLDRDAEPRPDSLYGAAKVWGEALARLYADKHGIETCALRIGSFRKQPLSRREMRTWISHGDMERLFRCCVDAPRFHHFVAYGLSANEGAPWTNGDLDNWLGYAPQDNGADWGHTLPDEAAAMEADFHGGPYCDPDFSGAPRLY